MVLAARPFVLVAFGLALMLAVLAQPFIAESQQAGQSPPPRTSAGSDDTTRSPTRTPGTQEQMLLERFPPWMLMVMVLSALAALLTSLFMIYQYINNIRTTEFHRQILLDAVTQFRFAKLMEEGMYERPPPPFLSMATPSYPLSPEQMEAQRIQEKEEERQRDQKLKERDEELKQFEIKSRQTARVEAAILVPRSLSVAGMGITGSFFIELTAILTVIFGIVILGLVGVLGTREIGPILAAIAGYVLGKTSSAGTGRLQGASPRVPAVPQAPPGQAPKA